ncbi:signal peptidase I [Streptomyces sp. EAG2]|uniref:signal peptidase I n=1 Tax=Streptomyces sp. EAG2 TaxID=2056495 RepID=UPI000C6D6F56|nr:signal peptidase I [Streptomyces sp. EAG2]PKR45807.1 signal peptidase I [Streptomyces sp. EAG2]
MTTGDLAEPGEPASGGRGRRVAGIVVAVLAGLVLLALAATAVLSVRIDGDSMEPTLHDGERVLPLPVQSGEVGPFDVVLMRTPGRDVLLVKRVVALPGDQVRIAPGPQQGHQRVLVRRAGAERWYEFTVPGAADAGLVTPCCAADGRRSAAPAARTVPKGKFFFLGDHADRSDDARTYGWADLAAVSGRVWMRTWPLSSAGTVDAGVRLRPSREV